MIEKIISIKNVGKFENYLAVGDVTFHPMTLIYSENGLGKTTLSAIFRSLGSGSYECIQERHTLGQDDQAQVSILTSNTTANFTNGEWDNILPGIGIFDPSFVNENVYAGDAVGLDHKRNLHSFVIGESGVQAARQVAKIDDDIRRINSGLRAKEDEIERHIIGEMPVNDFLQLAEVNNLDEKIAGKEKEAKTLSNAKILVEKSSLASLNLPDLDFSGYEDLLAKGLDSVSDDAERTIREHISKCMDEKGEGWIGKGLEYLIDDDRCPFCGQKLVDFTLISAYRDYFSQEYKNLKGKIARALSEIDDILAQDKIISIQGSIASNQSLSEFWTEHIEAEFPDISFEDVKNAWDNHRRLLVEHLSLKSASPLEEIVSSEELHQAAGVYSSTRKKVDEYNRSVDEVNSKIKKKKEEVGSADPGTAQRELELLRNIKKRYSDHINQLCIDHQGLVKNKKNLEEQKSKAKEDLRTHTTNIVIKYQDQINDYLKKFGADFRIVEAKEAFPGGKPSLNYQISINAVAIDLDAPVPQPCFKNTLSSGDKSTLAFAFFLAQLDQDTSLKDRIIIFDDPISSLDGNRRTRTKQEIYRISTLAKQVIVMSHDPYFLRLIWEELSQSEVKTLCITRGQQGSVIKEWDIEQETRGEYFSNYFALVEYLESGPADGLQDVARCIRPLLECNLRMRFPGQFSRNDRLGSMLAKIRDAESNGPLGPLKSLFQDVSNLNDYSKNFHHKTNPQGWLTATTTDGELKTYVEQTLNVIGGILSSTARA